MNQIDLSFLLGTSALIPCSLGLLAGRVVCWVLLKGRKSSKEQTSLTDIGMGLVQTNGLERGKYGDQ